MPLLNPADAQRIITATPVATRYTLQQRPLIKSLLPSILRRPKMMAWLQALLSPVLITYAYFVQHVKASSTELSYNGQTMLLEKALNDRFDPGLRRIKIINSDTDLEPVYFNYASEQQPMPVMYFAREGRPLLYLNRAAEYANQVGFTVQVPRSLLPQEAALQARIKQLKLALIRHTIIYI
jgi:hypothetical protein